MSRRSIQVIAPIDSAVGAAPIHREIPTFALLGASNVTLGWRSIVARCRAVAARLDGRKGEEARVPPIRVIGAHGLGRSYGTDSRFLFRSLSSILECELWELLDRSAESAAPRYALVTDVGNDIAYGVEPAHLLSWVDEAVSRLRDRGYRVVLTGLPIDSLLRVSRLRFLTVRTALFPFHRIRQETVMERAREVQWGIERLARTRDVSLATLRGEWYGIDPIHIRLRCRTRAWARILERWGG
ncbi:MAG: hypothetical protein KDC38_19000 [Planctomycetes bacterium]|nr:hypothetical protein [Planctomycetota bacterium]